MKSICLCWITWQRSFRRKGAKVKLFLFPWSWKKTNLKVLIILASCQSCIINVVRYVSVTQSQSIYFVRSLANKNASRQSKLLLGELSFQEERGWCSSRVPPHSDKSAVRFHPNALWISLPGCVFSAFFSQDAMLGQNNAQLSAVVVIG